MIGNKDVAGHSRCIENKREHLIPLTESALQELASVKELTKESNSPFIFPLSTNGERPVRTDSLARSIMYFRAFNPEFKVFTARDLRRTCKTLMGRRGSAKRSATVFRITL